MFDIFIVVMLEIAISVLIVCSAQLISIDNSLRIIYCAWNHYQQITTKLREDIPLISQEEFYDRLDSQSEWLENWTYAPLNKMQHIFTLILVLILLRLIFIEVNVLINISTITDIYHTLMALSKGMAI